MHLLGLILLLFVINIGFERTMTGTAPQWCGMGCHGFEPKKACKYLMTYVLADMLLC